MPHILAQNYVEQAAGQCNHQLFTVLRSVSFFRQPSLTLPPEFHPGESRVSYRATFYTHPALPGHVVTLQAAVSSSQDPASLQDEDSPRVTLSSPQKAQSSASPPAATVPGQRACCQPRLLRGPKTRNSPGPPPRPCSCQGS